MWCPLLISWLLDAASWLKAQACSVTAFCAHWQKLGNISIKTVNISTVHLAKSACYGFLVDFLSILHFFCCLCSLIDVDVTAEFYAWWSNMSMAKDWPNPSLTLRYTSVYFITIITQLFALSFSLILYFSIWNIGVLYGWGKIQPGGSSKLRFPSSSPLSS